MSNGIVRGAQALSLDTKYGAKNTGAKYDKIYFYHILFI